MERTLEERNKLVEDNIPLAIFITKRYRNRTRLLEFDDALSIAYVGLIKAATYYKPGKYAFSTYASCCMVQEFQREYDAQHRTRHIPEDRIRSIESQAQGTDGITLADTLETEGFEDDSINSIMAAELLATIKGRPRDTLERHFLGGSTFKEIADEDGVSHQAISLSYYDGLKKIRHVIAKKRYEMEVLK